MCAAGSCSVGIFVRVTFRARFCGPRAPEITRSFERRVCVAAVGSDGLVGVRIWVAGFVWCVDTSGLVFCFWFFGF